MDDETGEIFHDYRQVKEPLRRRPRHLVRLANAMRNLFVDDVIFGSGAGKELVHGLVAEITAPRRREDEQEAARQRARSRRSRIIVPRGHIPFAQRPVSPVLSPKAPHASRLV